VEFWLSDVPHAAIDKAVKPVISSIGSRALEALGEVTDIDASPIAGFTRASGYPLQRAYNTNGRGHRSALGGAPPN
jgi:hypothetical protein